ncbi:iron-hydroxamate ABC transporter substrate-binding protein [Mammaliicoccus stepanovicii]|uniref:Putative ferrichrome binding protein n=1 Tax=Mammaliicoccus stepanovicii TaxID=643214 RepID=A0A239YKF1_9STAP|nr:iron-hydroxamate ABC transporter substrate-binding protein [Mammaliicoccus stepanovicii]PNZ77871.1 ferrichrome ABC transporter substrate-binding protein [Mammaliicoccus stepanovicii]GGI40915.1 ferrichrome ABC transporter substrate-binding protein [Mammaliicoccus stepanovicii]SNV58674.1 putative ferrichrome binding protein [Mammaliicoccus stepanovicii]
MKKLLMLVMALSMIVAACGNKTEDKHNDSKETVQYKLDDGKKIDIPKNPKRIAVLSPSYVGGLIHLGIKPVGVPASTDQTPVLKDKIKGIKKVSEDNVEQVAELKPDLIITYNTDKNLKKYEKIAPTIPYDYAKHNYLDMQVELGKLVGKEDKAKSWVKKWKEQTSKDGKELRNKLGNDTTVSVIEAFQKDIYSYGENWGRGTEVLYQAFGLKMPKSVEQDVKKDGWKKISQEEIEKYSGDYLFLPLIKGQPKPEFMNTESWKSIPAVKNNRVIEVDAQTFWYNDPFSLEVQRKYLKEKLMTKSEK